MNCFSEAELKRLARGVTANHFKNRVLGQFFIKIIFLEISPRHLEIRHSPLDAPYPYFIKSVLARCGLETDFSVSYSEK